MNSPTLGARRVLVLMAAVGLAGCVMGPDYQRPPVPLPTTWRAGPETAADAADLVNTAWWKAFEDPDLTALIDTALAENKDLMVATLRIEQFDARLQISRSELYPQARSGVSAARERRSQERPNGLQPGASPSVNNFEISATMNWELDLWGRVKRSNERALAELLATEESRRAVMLTVVSSVATSYVQLLGLDQQLALARQAMKNRQDALRLVDAKFRGGSANKLAVAQARAIVEEVASKIPEIERQIATVENALSVLLGRNPGSIQRRSLETLALPKVPQGVPSDVLTRRPDVRAAEQKLVAANARIGVAKTEYFPILSLTGALGLASDDLRYIGAETARAGNFGAGLLTPLFTGGRIDGDIRETEALQKQSAVAFQAAVQTALQEVEDALVYRAKVDERFLALGRYVEALNEVSQLARSRYDGGQAAYLEVLEAELQLYAAQRQQAQSRSDGYLALISIYKAMGGGWMMEPSKLGGAAAKPAADVQISAGNESRTQK